METELADANNSIRFVRTLFMPHSNIFSVLRLSLLFSFRHREAGEGARPSALSKFFFFLLRQPNEPEIASDWEFGRTLFFPQRTRRRRTSAASTCDCSAGSFPALATTLNICEKYRKVTISGRYFLAKLQHTSVEVTKLNRFCPNNVISENAFVTTD